MHATTAASAARPGAPVPDSRFFINRNFALLWAGQTISDAGDWMFSTTLVLWIATRLAHNHPWAPLAVGGVFIAECLPTLLIGPFAGVFVDRWNKRRILLWADAVRAMLIVLLLPLDVLAPLPVTWRLAAIYAVVVLSTVCARFFNPARLALLGDIVSERDRTRASSRQQITMSIALVVGPMLAAPLYTASGPCWAIAVNALSFTGSFFAVLWLRAPRTDPPGMPGDRQPAWLELTQGLRFYAGNRVLMAIAVAVVVTMLGLGCLNALDIFFVTGNLHAPASFYGLVNGANGGGLLAGAVLGGLIAGRVGLVRLLWLSLLVLGLLVLAYARLSSFEPALVVLFLLGIANGVLNVIANPLLLQVTPRAYIGRVSAVLMPLISLASVASMAVAGVVDGIVLRGFHARVFGMLWGPVDTIFTAAGLLAISGGVYAMVSLRQAGAPASGSKPA